MPEGLPCLLSYFFSNVLGRDRLLEDEFVPAVPQLLGCFLARRPLQESSVLAVLLFLKRVRVRPVPRGRVRACSATISRTFSGAKGSSREFRACGPTSSRMFSGANNSSRTSSCLPCYNVSDVFRREGLFKGTPCLCYHFFSNVFGRDQLLEDEFMLAVPQFLE